MSAATMFRIDPPPASHIPSFSEHDLPLGWQRCAVCGALLDVRIWARTTCPGPRRAQELGGQ